MNLILENVSKNYGEKKALKNVTYEFEPGIYGLLGPNGAGKSTLMNLISQNLQPTHGKIYATPKQNILSVLGYMPQQQALYDDFSARAFLYYMASLKKIKNPKREIERLLKVVNLRKVAHKKIGSFSGGMKQRILLAQAMLGNPKILLLDEPTAGLDPIERIRIRNFISEFSKDKIVILATHVVSDIEFIAGKVIILSAGEIIGAHSTTEWLKKIDGKVFECDIDEEDIDYYRERYMIGNIFRLEDAVRVRIVGNYAPENAVKVKPTLEDVYLYTQSGYEI